MIYLQFNRFLFSYCSLRHLNMNQLNGTIPPLGNLTLLRDLYASFFLATHLTWWAIIQIDFTPNRFLFSFCGVALTGTLTRISSPAPSRLSSATSLSCNSCTLTIELLFYNIYCRLYVKVCPINRRGETVPISNYLLVKSEATCQTMHMPLFTQVDSPNSAGKHPLHRLVLFYLIIFLSQVPLLE